MANVLAVDIGGTKTLFELCSREGESIFKMRLDSQSFASFEDCLSCFLQQPQVKDLPVAIACMAVAGPVTGDQASVTKLPWTLDTHQLADEFMFGQVLLCNDFEAVGHGVACLQPDQLETLHEGKQPDTSANRAVIGAGTGLGQAILIPQQDSWQVLPTEGGHVDFAPTDRTQQLLLEHLRQRFQHVSYDRIVCGSGLEIIYHFLRDYKQIAENPKLRLAMVNGDAAAAISEFACQYDEPLARQALLLFFKIYGAQTGNLALASYARGGVYLAGGIAAKNLPLLKQSEFISSFLAKGRMQALMADIPVHVVRDAEVGLKGARLLAQKALYN